MPATTEDEALELQVLGDIQDVFDSWRDDGSSSDELEDDASSPQHAASGSSSYLGLPPLRSQARLSKRTLAQALSSLPAAPQAKRVKGAPSAAFAPFSTADYLERMASFNLLNFAAAAFPPSAAARAGWSSAGRDRLKCGCCEAAWKISDFTGLKGVAREKLAAKMRSLLRDNHRPTCPWRIGIDLLDKAEPLQETAIQPLRVAEVRRKADEMRPHLPDGLLLDHPLTAEDLDFLDRTLRSRPSARSPAGAPPSSHAAPSSAPTPPSAPAAGILAVFHWQLLPPAGGPSTAPLPSTVSRPGTPAAASSSAPAPASAASQTVVTCPLCARRLGLWSFTSTRRLDAVSSHAADCPSRACSVAERLLALAEAEPTAQPNRRQVREMVDALLGPKVTLDEVRGWKVEVDRLEGSALAGKGGVVGGSARRPAINAP